MYNDRFKREREIINDLVQQKGWLQILRETTPLTRAIDNYVDAKNKIGSPLACDIAPCHASKSGQRFYLLSNANEYGKGRCWVCGEVLDPYEIIMGFNGCDFGQAMKMVKDSVGFYNMYPNGVNGREEYTYQRPVERPLVQNVPQVQSPTAKEQKRYDKQRLGMKKLWDEAVSLSDPSAYIALQYLSNRGILSVPVVDASLKFHPRVKYYQSIANPNDYSNVTQEFLDEREALIDACEQSPYFQKFNYKDDVIVGADMGYHPALLQMLRGSQFEPRRVMKVYLNQDGFKLDLPKLDGVNKQAFPVKKVCFAEGPTESIVGAAVYLDPPSRFLMIGEGFETVAVTRSFVGIPSASTFNASGINGIDLPQGVQVVFVLVDHDASRTGDKTAFKLMEKYQNTDVIIVPVFIMQDIPEGSSGIDWADVLNQTGGENELPEWLVNFELDYDWREISEYYFRLLQQDAESNWQ